ncbi:MAG: hemerythrin domain-containing protein [Polyangiaceae bacterium]
MDFFALLGTEHARIAAVATALDVFVHELESRETVDLHEAIRFVTFFRGYSDGLHHEREETVLFPCLSLAGFSLELGPLAHLREQHHQQGRLLLDLEKAISHKAPWGAEERARLGLVASILTSFERTHMSKERELVFPVAQKELAAHVDTLEKSAERFERKRAPRWDKPWLEELASELVSAHPALDATRRD